MGKKYYIGRVETSSSDLVSKIKQALINNNVIKFTVPASSIPDELDRVLKELKTENIKQDIQIGEIVGNLKGTGAIIILDDEILYLDTNAYVENETLYIDAIVDGETLILGGN
jgi:SepF-like predicted cell division protein (DUF552 family)